MVYVVKLFVVSQVNLKTFNVAGIAWAPAASAERQMQQELR